MLCFVIFYGYTKNCRKQMRSFSLFPLLLNHIQKGFAEKRILFACAKKMREKAAAQEVQPLFLTCLIKLRLVH